MAQKLNIDIVARDKSKQALNGIQNSLGRLKNSVFNLRNAFIGLGAGIVIRGIVNAGMQIEELGVQLEALFGSAKKGQAALDAVTKFAKTTPFELSNIQQGVTALATVSEKAESLGVSFEELLKITGNTAVQLGGDFALASQQIQRSFSAGIGSADLFRDRAVTAMAGFEAGVKYSVDESVKKIAEAFGTGGKFGELTRKLSETLKGTISNLKDAYFTIQTEIAAGFFDELKRQLGDLKKFTEDNDQTIRRLSREMGENLAVAILKVSNALKTLTTNFRDYQSIIGLAAIATGGFTGKLIGAGLIIDDVKRRIDKLAGKDNEIKINLDALYDDMPQAIEKVKESVVDLAKVEETIAKAKAKELKLQNFLLEEANKKRSKFHELEIEGIKKFQELQEELKQKAEEERVEKIREEGSALENLKENYREFFENFNAGREIADIFFNSLQSVTKGIGDAVAQTIVFGKSFKDTFGNIARNILAQLISSLVQVGVNMVINATIGKKLQAASVASGTANAAALSAAYATPAALASLASFGTNAIPAQAALISTVALSNVLSSVKGFAKGGAVSKDQPILVGERGAELFIPNSTGQITQSARGTDTGTTNINFTINAVDVKGVEELLLDNRSTIVNVINGALNDQGKEALV